MKIAIKKDKKMVMVIGVALLLSLIVAGIFVLVANSNERKMTEQLEMGQKYLDEMDYEQAIVAYETAIEIDPKCEEAYLALADIYVALGDTERALEILAEGYRQTESGAILKRQEEILGQVDSEQGILADAMQRTDAQDLDREQLSRDESESNNQSDTEDERESQPDTEEETENQPDMETEDNTNTESSFAEKYFLTMLQSENANLIEDASGIPFVKTCDGEGWYISLTYYYGNNGEPKYVSFYREEDEGETFYTTYDVYQNWLEGYKEWILQNDPDYNAYYMYGVIHPSNVVQADGTNQYMGAGWEVVDYTWRFENE